MKHYIIVKFKEDFDYRAYIPDIREIFNRTLKINGISGVSLKRSNSDRANRYDVMIEITMEKSALPAYDQSAPHLLWKEKYGGYIDKKAIFDCE